MGERDAMRWAARGQLVHLCGGGVETEGGRRFYSGFTRERERQERGAPPDVVTVVGGPALAQPSERERRGRAEKRKLGEK
jgi:hypothetical protein